MAIKCFTKEEVGKYGIGNLSFEQQKRFVKERIRQVKRKGDNLKLQAVVTHRAMQAVMAHPKGPKQGLQSFLYTDRTQLFGRSSLDARFEAIKASNQGRVYAMMEELMPSKFGLDINAKAQRDLVYALFGEGEKASNPKFKDMAKDWDGLMQDMTTRYVRAGGDQKALGNTKFPQHHDPYMMGQAGFEKWYNDIIDGLDLDSMGIRRSEAPEILKLEYDNILKGQTDIQVDPIGRDAFGFSDLQLRNLEAQFFTFKDADSFLKYNELYTDSTPYTVMMDRINLLSAETSLMEHLGPNPDLGFKTLADEVDKMVGKGAADFSRKAYDNLAGHLNAPNSRRKFADFMQGLRSYTTAIKLPGAALAVPSDTIFSALTANYNGLPMMNIMKRYVSELNPFKKQDRELASKLWFTLDHMLDEATAAMRFSDIAGQTKINRFTTSVMRGSGLAAMTIAGKRAFHYEFMAVLGKGDFNAKNLAAFKRYGIDDADIRNMKNSKRIVREGVEYLDPTVLPRDTAVKVIAMINAESKYAVPESDLLVRTTMNQGSRKGEVGGEVLRTMTQFKTFPATIIANHWSRALYGFDGKGASRLGYISAMAVATTAMGAMILQLKEVSKGNTPRDWDNADFWIDAAMQGGSASLLGDVLNSDSRSFGNSFQDFVMGPTGGVINDLLWKTTLGSLDEIKAGEKDLGDIAKGVVGDAANYVPYQFWYSKAVMDRMFIDSMRKLGDPKWEIKKARREAERQQEFGNERYW